MIRRAALLALLALLVGLAAAAPAHAAGPPPVSAAAVIVAGPGGDVLDTRSANARLPIASITKLMTALVTLERADPDDVVTVSTRAVGVGESTIGLRAGERLTVRELLAAALIPSANDAAYALAAYVGGGSVERFVGYMNRRARELGLENTHYERPDGLDASGHYSSARDILELSRVAMQRPLIRKLVRTKRMRISGGRLLVTTNDLLRSFPGAIGVKTGFTSGAGWSEVAAARRNGVTIYAVLLGGPGREQRDDDLEALLEWGFSKYVRVELVSTGRTYATAAIPFTDRRVRLIVAEPASATVRVDRPLIERVVATSLVDPPVRRGDRLGKVCVDLGRKDLCRPLVAADGVADPGLGTRVGWYAGRALKHAGGMLGSVFGAIS